LFETSPPGQAQRETAVRLIAERFPEVMVENSYPALREGFGRDRWLCRAPSEAHVRRWAAAAGVQVSDLHTLDRSVACLS
jgi:hypothetical protein